MNLNLKKIVDENNKNADFTGKYQKNMELKSKLKLIGGLMTAIGFAVAAVAFILIGVFGNNLQSINSSTALLVSMFVMLVLFSVVFGLGLYVLRQASKLHTAKQEQPAPEKQIEIKVEKKSN